MQYIFIAQIHCDNLTSWLFPNYNNYMHSQRQPQSITITTRLDN